MALKYLVKHDIKPNLLPSSLSPKKSKKGNWKDKPSSWPDIRTNAQDGHIYLLADTRYPFGLTATITGGYYVNIDGEFYDAYNSEAAFTMADWSSYTDTEGYTIDYPTGATKAHIIDIYPQNPANNITAFQCRRVTASGQEEQGLLWAHFNINNIIGLNYAFGVESFNYSQPNMKACTSKNNILKVEQSVDFAFAACSSLEYLPIFVGDGVSKYRLPNFIRNCSILKQVSLKNMTIDACWALAQNAYLLENFNTKNVIIQPFNYHVINNMYNGCRSLKSILPIDYNSNITGAGGYICNCKNLEDTVIDIRGATNITKFDAYANSANFTAGIKGLRVSNEAPFDGATPQINVQYTGMDRTALVQLFNDLPTVNAGQIINIVGCTGTADLTADDELIATTKGWTITK